MAKTIKLERKFPVRALELRLKQESNRRLRDRLQALRWVSEGLAVQDAARRIGRCRQVVSSFVHKFNQEGLQGLLNIGRGPGRRPVLNRSQWEAVLGWIQRGPRESGQPFGNWDCKRLAVCIRRRWMVALSDEQVRRRLHKMGCRLLRPTHELPGKDLRERDKKRLWRFLWVAPAASRA